MISLLTNCGRAVEDFVSRVFGGYKVKISIKIKNIFKYFNEINKAYSENSKKYKITKVLVPGKNKNNDFQKNLQLFNGILDVVLKLGAFSIIFGAIIVHRYFGSMGAKSMFSQIIGSQSGLFAPVFGLGLIVFSTLLILAISPWWLRFVRNALEPKKMDALFSYWRIFYLLLSAQVLSLICALVDIASYSFLFWILIVIGSAFFSVSSRKVKFKHCVLYAFAILIAQFFSIIPWIILISAIENLSLKGTWGIEKDYFEIAVMIAWIFIYSLVSALYVSHEKADSRESFGSYTKKLVLFSGAWLYISLYFVPDFFINTAMSATSIRQTPKESNWWHVETSVFTKIAPASTIKVIKVVDKNMYFCGYSPMLTAERVVLCPSTVANPNLKTCYVFLGSEVRPITAPTSNDWKCAL